ERAGGDIPKQHRRLGPSTVLNHAIRSLAGAGRIIVVVAQGDADKGVSELDPDLPPVTIVAGGATRQESVQRALHHLASLPVPPVHVLVHDSARPFVPDVVLARLAVALDDGAMGAIPVLPVADTLVRGAEGIAAEGVSRDGLYRVQTPQAFQFNALCAAHQQWPKGDSATDDAQMVRAIGHRVTMIEGDQRLEKITMADDFARIAALNGLVADSRTGTGYDVHRLVEGKPLWLCGIEVAHSHGLLGHSDADVAIHALVDAILGALAEGDIGQHFPPSDERWRGAASARFLEFARDRVAARGGRLTHVDLTIICEAPKIGPHRDAMRASLAALLGLSIDRISVKATTTEGLGFTGRREGIAAQAVATVLL
ncbi:MAG: bifunctional 2-C-methyl-D-erythritol 4-phosphate cytidylyltransferase/2-C-methyl-D-erythritol 2,4-cyclodiphosphate synthase, partial [Sphingobium sp.]